ncbi:oxytocin-neurophysin 1-like isoform X2 [Panulirus ornatus]|uniref:oxytocin-neurophysin 1-like isoform X2 n=1 Tax=Panulirus ornatus TaxID=150431 RepID=UPI003A894FCA
MSRTAALRAPQGRRNVSGMQVGVVVVVTILVGSAAACFITNCPPGGKRSGATAQLGRSRTCASCGPDLQGRCMGPEICCGPAIGCFLGTREARLCQAENLVPLTCTNSDLKTCGRMQEGRCAAAGLCCTEDKCVFDSGCMMEESNTGIRRVYRDRLALLPALSDDQWSL